LIDPRHDAELYRELKDLPEVASVTLRSAAVGTFREILAQTLIYIITYYIAFACLLAVGVVYNSGRIALSERARELGSLRVMGFTRLEVSYILLGELALLTFVALPLGCLFGYGLASLTSHAFDTELYRVPMVIERTTYGFAVVVVVLAAVFTAAAVRRRLDRLNLVEVLKTRE
jgi:putative ABC transport system permease protein